MKKLWFDVIGKSETQRLGIQVDHLYIIGYAGRNIEKTKEHIAELAAIGVAGPKSIPEVYFCSTNLLTQAAAIEVVGKGTSGEIEFIIVKRHGELYVGIGSDHTDRDLEAVDVVKSKQACEKPLGSQLWKYEDVKDHWDTLEMTSWQIIDGKEIVYQKGAASDLLPLEVLVAAAEKIKGSIGDCLAYSGTVPLVDGFKYGTQFRGKIYDKALNRSLEFKYEVEVLPN